MYANALVYQWSGFGFHERITNNLSAKNLIQPLLGIKKSNTARYPSGCSSVDTPLSEGKIVMNE